MRTEPEVRQLRTFVAIVEHGGFTRAADALGLSQSTVSETVHAMERALGTPVFVKGRRRPTLTAAGEALLPHARLVLGALGEAVAAVSAVDAAARAVVTLGTSESISAYVLPSILADLRRDWPGARYSVVAATCAAIRADVREGRLVLGLVLEPENEGDGDEARLLAPGRLVLFARPDHRLAGRGADSGELAESGLFLSDAAGSFHGLVQRYLQADGYRADRLHSAGSVEGVKRGVAADPEALGLLPAHALQRELRSGELVEIPPRRPFPAIWLKAVWRRDARLPPQAQAVADRLARVDLARLPPPSG